MLCNVCNRRSEGDVCLNPFCFSSVVFKKIKETFRIAAQMRKGITRGQVNKFNFALIRLAFAYLSSPAQRNLRQILGGESANPSTLKSLSQLISSSRNATIIDMHPRLVYSCLFGIYMMNRGLVKTTAITMVAQSSAVGLGVSRPLISMMAQLRMEYKNRLSQGTIWSGYHTDMKKTAWYPLKGESLTPSIRLFSKLNIAILKIKLGELSPQEEVFCESIKQLPFTLTYNTDYLDDIVKSGNLLSLVSLQKLGIKSKLNTSSDDITHLANHDSVFFRFSIGVAPTKSRFGKTTLIFDPEIVGLYEHGWVSLFDMLSPIQGSLKEFRYKGTCYRRSVDSYLDPPNTFIDSDDHITPELADKILHYYPHGVNKNVHIDFIANAVFFGPDILEGIALFALYEVRSMGVGFHKIALRSTKDLKFLHNLLFLLFRPEAKMPSRVGSRPRSIYREPPREVSVQLSPSSIGSPNWFLEGAESDSDDSEEESDFDGSIEWWLKYFRTLK